MTLFLFPFYFHFILFCSIDPGEGQIKVNFDVMKAETEFGHVPLRRLSTKPAISPKDHALSTQWVWFWLDEKSNIWREYGSEPMVGFSDQL